jgi:hypothetical protein
MGVCGYTWDEVQQMPIDALARAINSRKKHDVAPWNALFAAFFGAPDAPSPVKESARVMSPALFDSLFP